MGDEMLAQQERRGILVLHRCGQSIRRSSGTNQGIGRSPPPVYLLISGFPDPPDTFDSFVKPFEDTFHVVKMCYPDMDSPTLHSFWGYSIKDVEHALVSVIQEYRQVHGCKEIFLHGFDWGAQVSLALASHHPHLITKLVVQDVGTIRLNEMPLYDLFVIVAYQSFLGTLFLFSRLFGSNQDSASRIITPLARCFPWQLLMFPNDNIVRSILHQNYAPYKGYPYFRMLFDFLTDYAWLRFTTSVPQFFAFGRLKHISFHSKSYLRQLERTPGCFYKGYNGSHWFHKSQEAEFQCDVLEFFGPLTG